MEEKTNIETDLDRRAARGGTALIMSRVVNQFIGLGVVWFQAHYLSVWAYGVFELFLGTVVIINTLGNVGVSDIARRFLPEFAEKDEDNFIAITLRLVLLIRFIVCAIVLLLSYVFYDKVGPFFNIEEYRDIFGLFAIGALFTTEAMMMTFCYSALLKQVRYVFVFTFYNIFRVVAFYLVLSAGEGLAGAFVIEGASSLILFFGLYGPLSAEYKIEDTGGIRRMPVKRMAKYGFFMYLNNLGNILFNTTTDKFVISAMLEKAALGYYSFATKLGYAATRWMPHNLIGTVIEPFVYRKYIRENTEETLSRKFSKIITLQAFFVLPTTIFILTFSEPVIRHIFDPKFLPASGILGGLAVTFAIASLRFPLSIVATAQEKVKLLFFAQTTFAIYNLVADIILVKYIGLWGAVLATGTATLFLIASIWIVLSRSLKLSVESGPLIKLTVNTLLMGLFFIFIKGYVQNLVWVIGSFLAGGSFYLIMTYFNPPYNREVILEMWKSFRSRSKIGRENADKKNFKDKKKNGS